MECLLQVGIHTAYIYHYLTTFGEEVTQIWSQTCRAGKILFLLTRYSTIAGIGLSILVNWPNPAPMGKGACKSLAVVESLVSRISSFSAEAAVLLCLHALLGAKYKWLALLSITFTIYHALALTLTLMDTTSLKVVQIIWPPHLSSGPLEGCWFAKGTYYKHATTVSYMAMLWSALTAILGIVTLVSQYRGQSSSIINVIRRDGALYYLTTTGLKLLDALSRTPGIETNDVYGVIPGLAGIAVPILSNTLLLNLRKVDNEDTKAIVSQIIFNAGKSSSKQTSCGDVEEV